MGTQPFLNRRFIRLQAVQRLYTFDIHKHANYENALAHITSVFTPDVFAEFPMDPAQLAQEAQQAHDLFKVSVSSPMAPQHSNERVLASVIAATRDYQSELAKNERQLAQGLSNAISAMNQACVLIWQLLAEWGDIANRQAARPKLSPDWAGASIRHFSDSVLLQQLQEEGRLAQLAQEVTLSRDMYIPLATDWYHQFVKQAPTVQAWLEGTDTVSEEQLWLFLVEEVIFKQKAIQAFFSTLDLHWAIHRHIVRKCVRQGIQQALQSSAMSLYMLDSLDNWQEEQEFYTHLTQRTLANEENLAELIKQKSKNWTLQRINALDKAIIKLALCEMLYFPTIPIKVSINEYIEIAKHYSIPKSKQFVNGLLDAIANDLQHTDTEKT